MSTHTEPDASWQEQIFCTLKEAGIKQVAYVPDAQEPVPASPRLRRIGAGTTSARPTAAGIIDNNGRLIRKSRQNKQENA
jgi:hypothetical protein